MNNHIKETAAEWRKKWGDRAAIRRAANHLWGNSDPMPAIHSNVPSPMRNYVKGSVVLQSQKAEQAEQGEQAAPPDYERYVHVPVVRLREVIADMQKASNYCSASDLDNTSRSLNEAIDELRSYFTTAQLKEE